ncbi:MAG: UbiX family flavin prenyltransferase [Planctomycetes bacterium]|nr:UbiX family flavin prenyltransferase [Planctomycetota bacterium]
MDGREIILAITGASGGRYALRLLDCLEKAGAQTHLIVSPNGRRLLADECDIHSFQAASLLGRACERVGIHDYEDIGGLLASGSHRTDGMVICPCSSNTLGSVASGLADNLIGRAASVTLKEGRRLVIVHREMPVNGVDLENMLRLQRAGAIICPASPGFYLRPKTVDDLIDFVVGRVLDLLAIPHSLNVCWQRGQETASP